MKNKEILKTLSVYMLLAAILYLFYRSVYALILLPPAVIVYNRIHRKELRKKRAEFLAVQFKDALEAVAAAMRAGYSMENAIRESLAEMSVVYGGSSEICRELSMVINETGLGVPLEDAFDNFASRAGVSDISTFSGVLRTAKRSGGDMVAVIRSGADAISSKVDTQNEISVIVSSKRLEQNLMLIMPPAIILYIDLTSHDLLTPLYGNITGVMIMTACLGIYALSFFISRRLLRIKV